MIPSWYHTLLFRQYPGYCTDCISARNHTCDEYRTIKFRSSSPPRSSRSGAMPSRNSQRRYRKLKYQLIVTVKNEVDRARGQAARPPERGLGGALHWQHKTQDKNRLLSSTHRSIRLQFARRMGAQTDTLQWRHIYCPFLYLLLGIGSFPFLYLPLSIGSLGQFWNALELEL